jgi:hypothetical protein
MSIFRLLDWLRFRGWTNRYWREDGNHARCSHPAPTWVLIHPDEPHFYVCPECGASINGYVITNNATTRTVQVALRGGQR